MSKWETGSSLMATTQNPKGQCSLQSPLEEVRAHFFFQEEPPASHGLGSRQQRLREVSRPMVLWLLDTLTLSSAMVWNALTGGRQAIRGTTWGTVRGGEQRVK